MQNKSLTMEVQWTVQSYYFFEIKLTTHKCTDLRNNAGVQGWNREEDSGGDFWHSGKVNSTTKCSFSGLSEEGLNICPFNIWYNKLFNKWNYTLLGEQWYPLHSLINRRLMCTNVSSTAGNGGICVGRLPSFHLFHMSQINKHDGFAWGLHAEV